MKFKPIIPMRKRCDCGKAVKNHHWLCDKCWGVKARVEHAKKQKKLCKKPKKKKIIEVEDEHNEGL